MIAVLRMQDPRDISAKVRIDLSTKVLIGC